MGCVFSPWFKNLRQSALDAAGVSGNSPLPYKFVGNSHEFIRQTGIPAHPRSAAFANVVLWRAGRITSEG